MLLLLRPSVALAQQTVDLTGMWDMSLVDTTQFASYTMLPGTVPADGPVWLRRSIYIPRDWNKKYVTLFLERPGSETSVYVNGRHVGSQTSRLFPHEYDVTPMLSPGERNVIDVRVSRGIVGKMELRPRPRQLFIRSVNVVPVPDKGAVRLDVRLGGDFNPAYYEPVMEVLVQQEGQPDANIYMGQFDVDRRNMSVTMPVGGRTALWDEFFPNLYRVSVGIGDDYYETVFGLRTQIASDGQPAAGQRHLWLRGMVGEACIPSADWPPADETSWTDLILRCKDYGLNMLRFSSCLPPEAAFVAADRLGFYILMDRRWQQGEWQRIIADYGHHPSFLLADSLSLPVVCGKPEIERNLCSADDAGFLLTSFETCIGERSSRSWREFCSPVVPLARFPRYSYSSADTLVVPVEAYNALYGSISPVRKSYYISDSLKVIAGGALSPDSIPMGKHTPLGTVVYPLRAVKFPVDAPSKPKKLTLTVMVGKDIWNHWDFWVYPDAQSAQLVDP